MKSGASRSPDFLVPGFGNWWPPVWVGFPDQHHVLRGEVGVLVKTVLNGNLPNRIFLKIEHDDESFFGALVIKDSALCFQLHKLQRQHLGESIEEIGDLEIDFLL